MAEKKGLGRGLSALFDENEHDLPEGAQASGDPVLVSISEIEPNRNQPRTTFDEEKLRDLADSFREHGVISPITVAPLGGGRYRIIAGERRWRASRLAGLKKVPVRVLDVSEKEIVELSLIENLQREDLNVIEEARGYRRLSEEYGMTQEEIAARVGKSRPVVANALRLLTLPEEAVDQEAFGGSQAAEAAHQPALLRPAGSGDRRPARPEGCFVAGEKGRQADAGILLRRGPQCPGGAFAERIKRSKNDD